MYSYHLNDNLCRVCLQNNGLLSWNDKVFKFSSMSYKDCYFRYTKLEESDSDPFPTSICNICSKDLKNAHMLFEKALESFRILQVAFRDKTQKIDVENSVEANASNSNETPNDNCGMDDNDNETDLENYIEESNFDERYSNETPNDNYAMDDKTMMEIEYEMWPSLAETEYKINKQISIRDNVAKETDHFIDIQKIKKPFKKLLEQQDSRNCDTKMIKIPPSILTGEKGKIDKTSETSSEQRQHGESYDTEQPILSVIEEADIILEQNRSEVCDPKSSRSSKHAAKPKRHYLMCSYCSSLVEGFSKLREHEAAHSEDRKRTEICPICGVKLYSKISLKSHMKTHDENRQKNHICEFCEKAFLSRGGLNTHRRIHLGLMVKCQICDKQFYRQIDLNRHLTEHSAEPLQKNWRKSRYTVLCKYCNKRVRTDKWKGHKAAHLNQPLVKCKICDKNFFARSNCVSHIRKLHKKTDYGEFIHYYDKARVSHLILKQEGIWYKSGVSHLQITI